MALLYTRYETADENPPVLCHLVAGNYLLWRWARPVPGHRNHRERGRGPLSRYWSRLRTNSRCHRFRFRRTQWAARRRTTRSSKLDFYHSCSHWKGRDVALNDLPKLSANGMKRSKPVLQVDPTEEQKVLNWKCYWQWTLFFCITLSFWCKYWFHSVMAVEKKKTPPAYRSVPYTPCFTLTTGTPSRPTLRLQQQHQQWHHRETLGRREHFKDI